MEYNRPTGGRGTIAVSGGKKKKSTICKGKRRSSRVNDQPIKPPTPLSGSPQTPGGQTERLIELVDATIGELPLITPTSHPTYMSIQIGVACTKSMTTVINEGKQ